MITNYQKNNVMELLFGKVEYEAPSMLYLGLSTAPILEDGTGVEEPVGNGYERLGIVNDKTSFSVSENGVITNAAQFTFNESTGEWGTVRYVFVADAAVDGNVLYCEALTKERVVQDSSSLTFPVGALSFTLYNRA